MGQKTVRALKDVVLWLYCYPFRLFVQAIGIRGAHRLSIPAAELLWHLSPQKRATFKRELDLIQGRQTSPEESRPILKEAFKILVMNELEVLLFPILNPGNIGKSVVCDGLENLNNALSAGKGALLLFAHFGANQMIMPGIGYRGYTMSQLSAPPTVWFEKLSSRKFTAIKKKTLGVMWSLEQSLPVTHINIFGSLRKAFECLQRNEVLGVAVDGGGGARRINVPMFGHLASFSSGSVKLAMRTGCAVLPVFMIRERGGRNRMVIEPELPMASPRDDEDAEIHNMQAFVQRLEHYAREYPFHYVQFMAWRRHLAEQGDDALFPEAPANLAKGGEV